MNEVSPPPGPLHLHHFGISVTDLDRSLEFYCNVLGAAVVLPPNPADNFDGRRAVLMLSNGMGLDVNEFASNVGDAFDAGDTGLDHLAFAADSFEPSQASASRSLTFETQTGSSWSSYAWTRAVRGRNASTTWLGLVLRRDEATRTGSRCCDARPTPSTCPADATALSGWNDAA